MPIVNVLGADLRWADDVACVQGNGMWKPTVRQSEIPVTCRKPRCFKLDSFPGD